MWAYLHSSLRCMCMLPGIYCPCTTTATPHLWARNKTMAVFPFALFHDSFALFPLPLHLPSWNPPFPAKTQETAKLDPRPSSSPPVILRPGKSRELCCYVMQDASSWLGYFTACLATVSALVSPHSVTVSDWRIGVCNVFYPLSQRAS